MKRLVSRVGAWLDEPMAVARLEITRIFAPLAILGFMSSRLAHADEWIGDGGFRVPRLPDHTYVPPLPTSAAWLVAFAMVAAGLALSAGWKTRTSALVFALTLVFVALSDKLAAFTVSKIGPVIVLAIASGPAGTRLGVDAWLARRRGERAAPATAPLGPIRFLQGMLVAFYCGSGIAKAGGDWLLVPSALWSHLHDSYQTGFAFVAARTLPAWAWAPMQYAVVVFEALAPLWFALRRTRRLALVYGLGMHVMIGLMFGPVVWFALLMMTLLVTGFAPERWLAPVELAASWLTGESSPRARDAAASRRASAVACAEGERSSGGARAVT